MKICQLDDDEKDGVVKHNKTHNDQLNKGELRFFHALIIHTYMYIISMQRRKASQVKCREMAL